MSSAVTRTGRFAASRAALLCGALILAVFASSSEAGAQAAGESGDARPGDDIGSIVDVLYLTNRARTDDPSDVYGGERGQAQFGRCAVSFEPIPLMDRIAADVPFYVPTETRELAAVEPIDDGRFWALLERDMAATSSRSVVVFVHGYNYDFVRTCRMAAAMQRSLAGEATVVMFSWPSNGKATDYVSDLADVEWSIPLLTRLVTRLANRIGPDRVQMLAHSMGSRGTIAALERVVATLDRHPVVGRLVLLAPDFDAQTFVDRLPVLAPLAGSITLYASSNDSPLKLSRQLSGYPRLGEAGEYLTVAEGLETIDVSPAGIYQVFGHEYFFYHPLVAADLAELLGSGRSASERAGLRARRLDGVAYWEIAAEP